MEPWSKNEVSSHWAALRDVTLTTASKIEDLEGFLASAFPEESCKLAGFLAADAVARNIALSRSVWGPVDRAELVLGGDWRGASATEYTLELFTTAAQADMVGLPAILNETLWKTFGRLDSIRRRESYSAVLEQAVEWLDLLRSLDLPPLLPEVMERYVSVINMGSE
jgi:hypothetical protein